MIEVNLLPTKSILSPREISVRRALRWALLACTAAVILDLAVFFLLAQLFKRQLATLDLHKRDLLSQSQQFTGAALDLRTVEEKASGIAVVQRERADVAAIITQLNKIFIAGIELVNLQVDASGTVSFSAKAADVASLGQFISKITGRQPGSKLNKIILTGLRQEAGSGYAFQVFAQYEKN